MACHCNLESATLPNPGLAEVIRDLLVANTEGHSVSLSCVFWEVETCWLCLLDSSLSPYDGVLSCFLYNWPGQDPLLDL